MDPRTVKRRAERLMILVDAAFAELSIVLCDDMFIQQLNRTYRNKDAPTDVLAFSMSEGEEVGFGSRILGDIVISVETADRQAREAGVSTSHEVTSLLIHGLLHLLGYDHTTPDQSRMMFAKARELEKHILAKKKGN